MQQEKLKAVAKIQGHCPAPAYDQKQAMSIQYGKHDMAWCLVDKKWTKSAKPNKIDSPRREFQIATATDVNFDLEVGRGVCIYSAQKGKWACLSVRTLRTDHTIPPTESLNKYFYIKVVSVKLNEGSIDLVKGDFGGPVVAGNNKIIGIFIAKAVKIKHSKCNLYLFLKGHAQDCAHDRQRGARPRKLEKMYTLFQVLCNGKSNEIVPKVYYLPPYST